MTNGNRKTRKRKEVLRRRESEGRREGGEVYGTEGDKELIFGGEIP